jgi:predicted nucleic acid-binding protein
MTGPEFLDSNILVYAHDDADPRKKEIARNLIKRAVMGEMVMSTQTLGEFSATLLHKFSRQFSSEEIIAILDTLAPVRLVILDAGVVRRAVEAHQTYGVHFYDGMIVAAAERAGCRQILSEDLNDGQKYFGVTVVNPFK